MLVGLCVICSVLLYSWFNRGIVLCLKCVVNFLFVFLDGLGCRFVELVILLMLVILINWVFLFVVLLDSIGVDIGCVSM